MRTLYYVPMLHTPKELGGLKEKIQKIERRRYGEQYVKTLFGEIEKFWKEAGQRIVNAGLFNKEIASKTHIFIDGLPNVADNLVEIIVSDLTKQNIPIYQIVKKLQRSGAKVHGTEDPKLLKKEYELWTKATQEQPIDLKTAQSLLEMRDKAIAERINETVPDNEIGVLFIGKAHDVLPKLADVVPSFKIIHP